MSDGKKFDVIAAKKQHRPNRLPLEEMGNVLLDAMQGTLVCLDHHHVIVDVSKAVRQYFGFEQKDLVGLSILLLVEDSERDSFLKFLNSTSQSNDVCYVRMMMNNVNEYRQVKILRKKKVNSDTVDVHSTTPRHSCLVETILILTLEDTAYIDITLHDIQKQEFYTKMNLTGEITFQDHRGALIIGYLPHEILSQSIFNFVYHEDQLVTLHALWKCVTTGSSKLQWRLIGRDETLVFLQTEYKLIADHDNVKTIVARNELLSSTQKIQFDELQTAWRHQCAADIKGNSSSFKLMSASDPDYLPVCNGACRICAPSLNMCFFTNKLQPLSLQGNIFDASKLGRPLTIQDYIQILIDNDKYMDQELANMINNIQSLTARYRRLNDMEKSQGEIADPNIDDKLQSHSPSGLLDTSLRRKNESDSIVRGILSNSIKYNHEKSTGDSPSTLSRLLNGDGNTRSPPARTSPVQNNPSKPNSNPENLQQQHVDFLKKYRAAKAKLESQLEFVRSQEAMNGRQNNDVTKRNTILTKLSQLEHIKNKHLARRHDLKRQTSLTTTAVPVNDSEQQHFLDSLFPPSSATNSNGLLSRETNPSPTIASSPFPSSTNQSNTFYPSNYQQLDSRQTSSSSSYLDDFLTPPPSSSSYVPVHPSATNSSTSVHSFLNGSFQGVPNDFTSPSSFHHCHRTTSYPY